MAVIAGACAVLVPRRGPEGAAWATVAGYATECVGYVLAVTFVLRRRIRAHGAASAAARAGAAPAPP